MPENKQTSIWTVTAHTKILEYLVDVGSEEPLTELAVESGLTGKEPMDFAVFNGNEVKLGHFIAVLMLCRRLSSVSFDMYSHKAITCVCSDLQSRDLTRAITITAPADQYIQSSNLHYSDVGDAIHCRTLDKRTSAIRTEAEFSDLLSTGEPIIYIADTTVLVEKLIPPCPYEIVVLGPIDREIIGLVLAFEYPDETTVAAIAALKDLPEDQQFEHITPFDLICACRAKDPVGAIDYLIRCPNTPKQTEDDEDKPDIAESVVPLDQLVGYGDAKIAAQDMLNALACYKRGELAWADVPRGLLLIGAPGTGKTELARAMSRTGGISFVAGSFSEWQKRGHLGDFLRAMSNTFEEAKKNSPSVLFIDEMDSFQKDADGKNSSYDTKAVKGILEQLDGIRGCEGVGVVAAANNLERIPAAIRRSGRFDNIVTIPLPERSDLAVIFKQHLKRQETDIDLQACSVQALGKTGADCAAAVRKGRAIARRTKRQLTTSDILHSLNGDFRNLSEDLRFRMSVHECGHALLGNSYQELTVEFLRISEQGGECRITGQEMVHTAATMHRDRTILMGGRMAEILLLGTPSSGSGGDHDSDLAKIAISAANEAGSFGFGQNGAIWLGASNSEALLRDVYNCNLPEVTELIAAAEVEARRRLEPIVARLTVMAKSLMETSVLTGDRLTELLSEHAAPDAVV
ncbi:hypothetical protein DL239_08915 [Sedimentitalea sp. CY04]|uniref:AAA+ ATPase domain-containing protein n=1 Tax=Parasedimentitalea denitrificans TaxID=2211118 RepID=A0ABX0WAA4_9RHOB|nr:AAA family ATPase [Sedimentitalea sp. CY04]NIZ61096.1 hypothetical protein [Sedimentitalea sp. CY04]